jgi:CheY-like chemotaxis protein
MFTQMDGHKTYSKTGLGIGLTLVKKLVSIHNGEISVVSEGEGKGSEFIVNLPLAVNKNNPSISFAQPDRKLNQGHQKVLIVDDHVDILNSYKLFLEKDGYEVQTTSKSEEAIDLFRKFKPDFALLDIGMPGMNGYELCQELKKLPEAEETLFFSQSGWGNKEDRAKSQQAGFDEHFVKPLKAEQLRKYLSA